MSLLRRLVTAWSAGWHPWCHAPLTPLYAGLTLGLGLLAAGLVLPTGGLPVGIKYLLMLALLGWPAWAACLAYGEYGGQLLASRYWAWAWNSSPDTPDGCQLAAHQ